MYRRRVRGSQNVDARWIRDVMDVAVVKKLDYRAQNFVNVVECMIEHSFPLLSDSQVTLFFSFLFLCLLFRFGVGIIAPINSFIDYLLKTFDFTKKQAPGPENKTS